MKRIKATKTNIEKLHHPIGKTPDKHFASNCSGLCVIVQPEPSSVKSYYGHWSKIILQPDGKQKRSGRYKYICRVGDKPIDAVMAEVKAKLKDWKKEKSPSSKTKAVADLVKAFIQMVLEVLELKKKVEN